MRGQIRRFTDDQGIRWAVRAEWRPEVVLAISPGGQSSYYDRLWLYFRSSTVTRRTGLFPEEWYDLDDTALIGLMYRATRTR